MPLKTSIILCTYNESKYIEKIIFELEKNISNLELVIVDDNSTDGTIEIIKKINQNNKYKVVFRKRSRSLASAFVRGIIETSGDYIGWVDTNMSELAPKFNLMIKELEAGNDLIILSRYIEGGGDKRVLTRSLGSKYFVRRNRISCLCGRVVIFSYYGIVTRNFFIKIFKLVKHFHVFSLIAQHPFCVVLQFRKPLIATLSIVILITFSLLISP